MSFYDKEEQTIQGDEKDNLLIAQLAKKYQQIKTSFELTKQENSKMSEQIIILKEQNQKLQDEIGSLKAEKKLEECDRTRANMFIQNEVNNFYRSSNFPTPMILNRTADRTVYSQQTKRRVINGFVGELTVQLQHTEQMLRKERKMQEQSRKALQLSAQQVSTLRITVKDLQNRVLSLSLQNQKLFKQLEEVLKQKSKVQEHLTVKLFETNANHDNHSRYLDLQEFQNEMNRMDAIYQNIELQLSMQT